MQKEIIYNKMKNDIIIIYDKAFNSLQRIKNYII